MSRRTFKACRRVRGGGRKVTLSPTKLVSNKRARRRRRTTSRRGTRAHRHIIRGGMTHATDVSGTDATEINVRIKGPLSFFGGVYQKNPEMEEHVKQARARCLELIMGASMDNDEREHFAKFFKENESDSQRKYWFSENGQYRLECIMGSNAHFIRQVLVTDPIHPYNISEDAKCEHPSENKSQGTYTLSVNKYAIPDSDAAVTEGKWLLSWIPKLYKVPHNTTKYIVEGKYDNKEDAEFIPKFDAQIYENDFEVTEGV